MARDPDPGLGHQATRPVFILVDVVGIALLAVSQFFDPPWSGVAGAIGAALLAIGLSLPIALHYQLRSNVEALGILDACSRAGIIAIYQSRQEQSERLRNALDKAALKSTKVALLGVAFRSLFSAGEEYTAQMQARLDDPQVELQVLLLDPESPAAIQRARLELGRTTIADIEHTLDHGLPAMIRERLKKLLKKNSIHCNDSQESTDQALSKCNCEVRVYEAEPMLFLMAFEKSIFTEQYHIGRPDSLRAGGCIGKHVPVIQFRADASSTAFYMKHFEELWEQSRDVTKSILENALNMSG